MIKVRDAHGWTRVGEEQDDGQETLNIGMVGYGFMGRPIPTPSARSATSSTSATSRC